MFSRPFVCLVLLLALGTYPQHVSRASDAERLGQHLQPWYQIVSGQVKQFTMTGHAEPIIDRKPQPIEFKLTFFGDDAFDLEMQHEEYAFQLYRREEATAFCLPKHKVVFLGNGSVDSADHLRPLGILGRLIDSGTALQPFTQMLATTSPQALVSMLKLLTKLEYLPDQDHWSVGGQMVLKFADSRKVRLQSEQVDVELQYDLAIPVPKSLDAEAWPDMTVKAIARNDLERQLSRGVRRALEILAPSALLTSPRQLARKTEHGELRWIDGQRVVLLSGSPEQIGKSHGELLKPEAMRCIDSVLYAFGTAQTIVTGRWFQDDLAAAYARLAPHIPDRHKAETRALAVSLGVDPPLLETLNVFPELFHCSGFAVFGKATQGGKLYHGRVLDYMTTIGLQDAATTFIVAPQGMVPFANVGYAGFVGSVSGMNAEQISLGEMGGRGEGRWDGVPMATLMRRALEECRSLDEVKRLWSDNPRTCEYYYVFADGKAKTAVGVAATPEDIQFVAPGEFHPLLGEGIEDVVVLSAGDRLETLRKRIQEQHGKIDAEVAKGLMARPVAMRSNLHNVLFVPEDGVLYVANASHRQPAAERPYAKLDLNALLGEMTRPAVIQKSAPVSQGAIFEIKDSLHVGSETNEDARGCLEGLCWNPESFTARIEAAQKDCGDWLVRFPSPKPTGISRNDLAALEWYQSRDDAGNVRTAPAFVIIHESGSGMTVGRLIAKTLRAYGVHTFMLQLPHYGLRRGPDGRPTGEQLIASLKQGIADARRAKDVVAALPYIEPEQIAIQGTSLGGFVTATAAGLDGAYQQVFVLLAGGNVHQVLQQGEREAAKIMQELEKSGLNPQDIRQALYGIEPLRIAHRLDPDRTWLYSGQFDSVVPPASSYALARAIGLDPSHHVEMMANHYTGIIFLPAVTKQMRDILCEQQP